MKVRLPLGENIIRLLGKSVWIPLGLTGAKSATDIAISKKTHGSLGPGMVASCRANLAQLTTALIILNNEMEIMIKMVKFAAESGLIIKGANETIKNKAKA